MKTRFLWIEDGAIADLKYLLAPVYVKGVYDPVIALDVSDGIRRLNENEFAAVIVDIRIPPGNNPDWIKLYNQSGMNKAVARLGLQLLHSLLKPGDAEIRIANIPAWIDPSRFGVLTVESQGEVQDALTRLGITVYQQKTARTPHTVLQELVGQIHGHIKDSN